jgi:hypothetical protein
MKAATEQGNDSTKYDGSVKNGHDFEVQTQISEIESKFTKKKKNFKHMLQSKMYKEDEELREDEENIQPAIVENQEDIR